MLNRVFLIGRLTADPNLRFTPQGTSVATFTVAVDTVSQTPSGERRTNTDFIDVVVWRKQAVNVANYLKKGRLVFVEGRLAIRSFETQDGQKRKKAEVIARQVKFLERAGAPAETVELPELPESEEEELSELGTGDVVPDTGNDIPL
ncbi:MAG: single-stranded DNA-binding protein [Coprothermobacterota bacterium]|jgi:single-strand DNA-binding protein|nr:single-stranded DNA-binding protein [Caldisericota bacterium]MDI6868452.1 single-stranded DNA-binding protein [Coprothermobacterota bacterium]